MITAIAYAADTLNAPVEILHDINEMFVRVRTLPGGVGGWSKVGKELCVRRSILRDITDSNGKSTTPEPSPALSPAPLNAPIDAEDYVDLLLARQAAWHAARPHVSLPLLPEHFIEDGDEKWVILPDAKPAPKRQRTARRYRPAADIRAELADVEARMARIAGSGPDDPAAVNLSPFARSRAARNAGRRRFAQLDRDLERYTKLAARRDTLAFALKSAEAREAKAAA